MRLYWLIVAAMLLGTVLNAQLIGAIQQQGAP